MQSPPKGFGCAHRSWMTFNRVLEQLFSNAVLDPTENSLTKLSASQQTEGISCLDSKPQLLIAFTLIDRQLIISYTRSANSIPVDHQVQRQIQPKPALIQVQTVDNKQKNVTN